MLTKRSMNSCEKVEDLHISVLLDELVWAIKVHPDRKNIIVDCTLGLAGHACKMIEKMNPGDTFIGFDADENNLKLAKERIEKSNKNKIEVILIHSNFLNLKEWLLEHWITSITGIYYDLWLSSVHIDNPARWFSFQNDGPLDMRFDKRSWIKASEIVNTYHKDDLEKIFSQYWEEPSSRKVAEAIALQRKEKKFTTTKELADLIWSISRYPKSKTRIFQALRIEVNSELKNLEISLHDAIELLETDGNIFAISFHSLEDRIVKQKFKRESKDCICRDIICSCGHTKSLKILTKKPILPTEEEQKQNSRSRSAKARHAKKI